MTHNLADSLQVYWLGATPRRRCTPSKRAFEIRFSVEAGATDGQLLEKAQEQEQELELEQALQERCVESGPYLHPSR
jgi:hypothetical protein